MRDKVTSGWNSAKVREWLENRVVASKLDQVAAERAGRGQQDECDKATAEEMVCTILQGKNSTDDEKAFVENLRALLDCDEFVWRGVYDDARFDRHARSYIRGLIKMAKTNNSFEKTGRYQ